MATAGISFPPSADRKLESITTTDYFGFTSTPASAVSSIPNGFPAILETGQAWTPAEYADETRFVVDLTTEDKQELDEALEAFKCMVLPYCSSADFY